MPALISMEIVEPAIRKLIEDYPQILDSWSDACPPEAAKHSIAVDVWAHMNEIAGKRKREGIS